MSIYLDPINREGFECETCGWSADFAQISFNGKWEFQGSWGCYGGEHFEGTREELIDWLDTEFSPRYGDMFTAESIERAISALQKA